MSIISQKPAIKLKIINTLPKNVWLSVKKIKHQSTFKIPLAIKSVIVLFGILSLLDQIRRTMAKVRYIIVQTTGITKLGIHCDGLLSALNQSIPKLTKRLPSPATTRIGKMIDIHLTTLFFML